MTVSGVLLPDGVEARSIESASGKHVNAYLLRALEPTGHAPSVLVHGFRGVAQEWGPLAALMRADRDVWILELPGHDQRSDEDARAWSGSTADHLEAIDAVHAASGAERVEIIGQSYGGYLVARWSASRPGKRVRTVVMAPALVPLKPYFRIPGMKHVLTNPAAARADRAGYLKRLDEGCDAFWAGEMPDPSAIPVVWREELFAIRKHAANEPEAERREQQVARTLLELMPHNCSMRESRQIVAAMPAPVLWLHGSADPLVPFEPSRRCAEGVVDTFVDMGPIGHSPQLECPDRTMGLIRSWREALGDDHQE